MHWLRNYERSNLRGDLLGGLTSAVVALPLALAFGNAALGPGGAIYGLYGAIVTGFIAAILGGTPAQVTGPTGPMSVTVSGIVASLALAGVKVRIEFLEEQDASVDGGVLLGGAFGREEAEVARTTEGLTRIPKHHAIDQEVLQRQVKC